MVGPELNLYNLIFSTSPHLSHLCVTSWKRVDEEGELRIFEARLDVGKQIILLFGSPSSLARTQMGPRANTNYESEHKNGIAERIRKFQGKMLES